MQALETLTLGEVARVEELSGMSITAMGAADAPQAKLMAAVAYVLKRREDAEYKFADAMNLTMEQVGEFLGLGDTPKSE